MSLNNQKQLRLLVADDNPLNRAGMRALLETAVDTNIIIYEASDGKEAIRVAELMQPDLILMDVQMPHMDGIEATRIIKNRWPQIKVIILTLYAMYHDAAIDAGADQFLLKGSAPDTLLDAIFSQH